MVEFHLRSAWDILEKSTLRLGRQLSVASAGRQEGRPSFLQKRSKKLLFGCRGFMRRMQRGWLGTMLLTTVLPASCAVQEAVITPPADGAALLRLVKKLADNGRLDDTAYVGRMLATHLVVLNASQNPGDCGARHGGGPAKFSVYAPAEGFWFRRSRAGTAPERNIAPGTFQLTQPLINLTEEPTLRYVRNEIQSCDPSDAITATVSVSLAIETITGFDCVSPDMMQTIFPSAQPWLCARTCLQAAYAANGATVLFAALAVARPGPRLVCLDNIDLTFTAIRRRA